MLRRLWIEALRITISRRKIRCNSAQPCDFCLRAKASCTFTSAYSRGRVPSVLPASLSGVVDDGSNPAPAGDGGIPVRNPLVAESTYNSLTQLQNQQGPLLDVAPYAEASSHNSPEPSQTDLQGHYIGPASGVSFLHRIQRRLHQALSFSPASSIFTFGDAPLQLAEFDPSFCMMLPRPDAQRLIDRYFDFAMPTYRFLHRPTIQEWFDEFYDTLGTMRDVPKAPAKVALLFMVFAHARVYMPEDDRPGPPDLRSVHYLAKNASC